MRDISVKTPGGPRRILALSGGGVRGIVEVAFLEAVEQAYKARYGPQTQLCDVFDLVGGTSTGALIATALSLGHPMSRVHDFYVKRASVFFKHKRWWNIGRAPLFDCDALEREFRHDVGNITLGDARIKTLLAIVAKRFDTGSPWILNNIPSAPYFADPDDGSFIGNTHLELAQLLGATTAAPIFFSRRTLHVTPNGPPGVFIDGGLTPYNDPSLALLQVAGLQAYGLNWPFTPKDLFVLSIGTGHARQQFDPKTAAAMRPYQVLIAALRGLSLDAEHHSLKMMEWMGVSPKPMVINSEIGSLEQDRLGPAPLFTYLRLDLPLAENTVSNLSRADVKRFASISDPDIIEPLYHLTKDYVGQTFCLDTLLP